LRRLHPVDRPVAKPDGDFAGKLDELCRVKVAELVQAYLEAEVDELLGGWDTSDATASVPDLATAMIWERTVTSNVGPISIRRPP